MNQTHHLMLGRVFELLTELSIDPFKQEALRRDPAGTLGRAGLSEEEQELVGRWFRGELRDVLRRTSAFVADPGDDPTPNPDPIPEQPSQPGE